MAGGSRRSRQAGGDAERAEVNGTTPLFVAAAEGHAAVVRALADGDDCFGENVNAQTPGTLFTPLCIAAMQGRAGCVRLLLELDADPTITNCNGETPLQVAQAKGRPDVLEALSDAGVVQTKMKIAW